MGDSSPLNTLIVTNGGRVGLAGEFIMGYNASGTGNTAVISGTGSLLQFAGNGPDWPGRRQQHADDDS